MRDQRRPEGPLAEESAVTAVIAPHPSPQLPQVFWQYLPARSHLRHCITAELGNGSRQTVCEGLRKYQLAATTRYGGQKLRSSSCYSTTKGLHSGSGSAGPAHHWLHLPRVRCTHNPIKLAGRRHHRMCTSRDHPATCCKICRRECFVFSMDLLLAKIYMHHPLTRCACLQ